MNTMSRNMRRGLSRCAMVTFFLTRRRIRVDTQSTMTINDIAHETYTALSANKVRSGLTMLGIVIGISSVIAMVSIGTGASNTISSSIESLGSNLIQVTPGTQQTQGFGASS